MAQEIDLTTLFLLAEVARSVENDEGEFWFQFGRWSKELQRLIQAVAESNGCDFIPCDRVGSQYPRIEKDDETCCEVRISQHGQRYAGACWSFELTDTEDSIRRGLAMIASKCN